MHVCPLSLQDLHGANSAHVAAGHDAVLGVPGGHVVSGHRLREGAQTQRGRNHCLY